MNADNGKGAIELRASLRGVVTMLLMQVWFLHLSAFIRVHLRFQK